MDKEVLKELKNTLEESIKINEKKVGLMKEMIESCNTQVKEMKEELRLFSKITKAIESGDYDKVKYWLGDPYFKKIAMELEKEEDSLCPHCGLNPCEDDLSEIL